jgi:hypothetical protein
MPSIVNFNGRQYIEPGAAARIIGGFSNPPAPLTSGNVLIIDDGIGAGFGFGAGINGEFANGAAVAAFFDNPRDAKKSIRGGMIWDLIDYIFNPDGEGNGARGLYYFRAATTIAAKSATISLAVTTGVVGNVRFGARDEGTGGNGVILNSLLTRGYGWKIKAGVIDTTKFIIEFYQGQFRGLDAGSQAFDVAEASVPNLRILSTPEFKTANELITWMTDDYYFNQWFKLVSSVASADTMAASNLSTYTGMQILSGGTEVYNAADMDSVLDIVGDLDFNSILSMAYGANAAGANNFKIFNFQKNVSEYERLMFIGGGKDSTKFSGSSDASKEVAVGFDTSLITVVHSGIKMPKPANSGIGVAYKNLDSIYHAALHCGIHAGLAVQVPATYKAIKISGLLHMLTKSQRVNALTWGVEHTRQKNGKWIINQGITTLQKNTYLINTDGSTPSTQVIRVAGQLNKELIADTEQFIGQNGGTVDAVDLKSHIEGFLLDRTAKKNQDNYILGWKNVTVRLVQDYWEINYGFYLNPEINKVFTTGIALDPNLNA